MAIRGLYIVSLVLFIGACAQAPMKPSPSHVQADGPAPSGTIPAPVQFSTALPKPRPTLKPETYSVVVNNVDVNELLFALARDAKINVDIQPGISGRVTLNAIDQTLEQLLSRIARQVDVRWELHGPNLAVIPDKPFLRSYRVDYPALERRVVTTVSAEAQVSGGGSGGGGAGGAGGAAGASGGSSGGTKIIITQANTFWVSLAKNIEDLIREEAKFNPLMVTLPGVSAQGTGAAAATVAAGATAGSPVSGTGAAAGPGVAGAGTQQAQGQAGTVTGVTWVIPNPEAGVLWVRATSRLHEKVQEYLDQVTSRVKRQVLIEATIAEVQLNNQYQRGIDWSLVRSGPGTLSAAQSVQGTSTAGVNSSLLVLTYAATGVSATLRLLESFGNVRVLSSPKISVLNNQTAILKVVDDLVYFTVSAQTTQTANAPSLTSFTTTPKNVSVGFVMNVTPQISDTDSVLLNVRPSVSRVLSFVNDPNPSLGSTPNRIPQIQTREMESMIRVDSGQIAVMGGLIQDSMSDNEDTIPGLSQVPGIGSIFSNRNRGNTKTELVIFIRPMVVRDPSIDGDFRALRQLVPDSNFISAPNPGKSQEFGSRP